MGHEKKGSSEVVVQAVVSLYDGAKTRGRVRSTYSKEFKVKAGVHQRPVLLPLLFAIVVYVIPEKVRRGVIKQLLYADDLALVSEIMEDLKEKLWNWKDALENKSFKVNIRKTEVTNEC